MDAKILEKQYKLITEDNTTTEDKIGFLQILSSKVNEEERKEIASIIEELEKIKTRRENV